MKDKLKQYVDILFAGASDNSKNRELKEELLGNLYERYDDFLSSGMTPEQAYNRTISGIGDISELLKEDPQTTPPPSHGKKSEKCGDPPKVPLYSEAETERKRRICPILQAVAITLYVLAVLPAILWNSDYAAIFMFGIVAIATGIIIYTTYTRAVLVRAGLSESERLQIARNRHGAGIMRAIGVALYIICVCPSIIFDSNLGVALMFVIIAAATFIMILTSALFPIKEDCEAQFTSESEKVTQKASPVSIAFKIINGIFWVLVIIFYLIVSIVSGNWWITWVIFPAAGFISGIVSGICNLVCSRKIASSIVKISICSVLLVATVSLFGVIPLIKDIGAGIISFSSVDNSFYADANDSDYIGGEVLYNSDGVKNIEIDWASGNVELCTWEEDKIKVVENGGDAGNSLKQVHSKLKEGKLTIKFSAEEKRRFRFTSIEESKGKELTVYIPEELYLTLLDIETISSDIMLEEISGSSLDISAVSGDTKLANCAFNSIESEAVSGDMNMLGDFSYIEISMVSGNVIAEFTNAPKDISVETVSGNIELDLPEDISGFTLSSDSVSDTVNITDMPTTLHDGDYVHGDGSTNIDIDSVSGKITLK